MSRTPVAPPIVENVLRSSGQPLDNATRHFIEPRFHQDFGDVRLHTDTRAAESARAIDAAAYTVGNHVVFGAGQHAPNSPAGRRLLAHELTHVVQQARHVHRQPERDPEADKAKVEACLKQKNELLPKVGVVAHIDRDVALNEILGKERQSFESDVRNDYKAREFVCEAGIGAVMALFYNRDYHNRLWVDRARQSFAESPGLYSLAAFDKATTTKELLKKKYRITTEPGDKEWSTEDIGLLAQALGKLTDREIPLIGGYRFIRWTTRCNQRKAANPDHECELKEDYSWCGLHEAEIAGRQYTITMYDCMKTDPENFARLGYDVQPGAETIVHEIGHAMEYGKLRLALEKLTDAEKAYKRLKQQADAAPADKKAAFTTQLEAAKKARDAAEKARDKTMSKSVIDKFLALTKGKRPLTPYSNKGANEAFAEAFMLFKVAPKKLKKANKKLFDWFDKGGFI